MSKKRRLGSTERIADGAVLAGDLLIERFTGSAGGGHIKEQQLMRTPPSVLHFYLFHSNVSPPLFIYVVSVRGAERNINGLLLRFPSTGPC